MPTLCKSCKNMEPDGRFVSQTSTERVTIKSRLKNLSHIQQIAVELASNGPVPRPVFFMPTRCQAMLPKSFPFCCFWIL